MDSGSSNAVSQYQQQQQQALASGSSNIEKAFSGFTPQFYQNYENSYINQALPQLGDQYRSTLTNLNYSLGDRGLLTGSSAKDTAYSALNLANTQNENQIVNQAQTQAQNLQQTVGGQKAELYGELQQGQNPTQIGQSAVNLAAQTSAPSVFAPLGQAFQNFSNTYLASQAAGTYNPTQSSYLYNPFYLSGSSPNSGAVAASPLN